MATIRVKALIGGVGIGLLVLASTTGALFAQEPTAMPGNTAMAGQMDMMETATPGADAAQMQQMMEQCTAMMEMMTMMMGMMGGDMAGMMEGEAMPGMEGTSGEQAATATPEA